MVGDINPLFLEGKGYMFLLYLMTVQATYPSEHNTEQVKDTINHKHAETKATP
jgi:hypothetical protein